jgi:hypothetical protein
MSKGLQVIDAEAVRRDAFKVPATMCELTGEICDPEGECYTCEVGKDEFRERFPLFMEVAD